MTSLSEDDINLWRDLLASVKKNKSVRKDIFDLRFTKPSIGKKWNLAEVYETVITDYVYFFEKCLIHDLEFQGKPPYTNPEKVIHENEIQIADDVSNFLEKMIVMWIHAQDMVSRSIVLDNLIRQNKWKTIPSKEIHDFLNTSKGYRDRTIVVFSDAFLISLIYLIKHLNLELTSEEQFLTHQKILFETYKNLISRATEQALKVGIIPQKLDVLIESFEVESLVNQSLQIYSG
jgi:hypothetical protein